MKTLSLILISIILSLSMNGNSFIFPSKAVTGYNSLADIFRTIDPAILPHGPIQPTEGELQSTYVQVLNQKAAEIRNYVALKYREDLSDLSNIDVIVLGLGIVPFESRESAAGFVTNEQIFNCFLDALQTAGGIYGLVQSFISLWNNGASVGTLLSTVKSIFKVGGGWFMAAYGVYKFGGCVGWW